MPNQEHVARLLEDHTAWDVWRQQNPELCPDLSKAKLSGALLSGANLSRADLRGALLSGADLSGADLGAANLSEAGAYPNVANLCAANLSRANLSGANLSGAIISVANLANSNLSHAYLAGADLCWSNLSGADLSGSVLYKTHLIGASLKGANLMNAEISEADLSLADLSGANLTDAHMLGALVFRTNFYWAELTKGRRYDVPAWKVTLDQSDKRTLSNPPGIELDSLLFAKLLASCLTDSRLRTDVHADDRKIARVHAAPERVRVYFGGRLIADSRRAICLLEPSHPPVYYIPRMDLRDEYLQSDSRLSFCEVKGVYSHWRLNVNDRIAEDAAWSYEYAHSGYEEIQTYLAFYPSKVDEYFIEEKSIAMPKVFSDR